MMFTVTSGAGFAEVIDHPASARAALELGRVDEFDQAKGGGKTDDGSEVSCGLFAA
jgi:hypothetical protein